MRFRLCCFAALLAACPAARADEPAAAPPKPAASRIVQVTVYPNSALVTREVDVPAGAGSMELTVTPLPPHTINSSLYSEGSDGTRVLTTRFRTRPVERDTREEVRKLEDEIKKLHLAAQKLQSDVNTTQQNLQTLAKLETFTAASTTHATEKGKLDSEATLALVKYVLDGRAERNKELVALQQQLTANSEQTEFLQRKLRELTAGSSRTERDAVIVVDKTNAAPGKVRLNYLVDRASWRPQYKLRAGTGANEPILIEYLAAVVQQSGEDWAGVRLVLSTAQPMLNAAPPELRTLTVNVVPRGSVPPGGRPGMPSQMPMPQVAQNVGQAGANIPAPEPTQPAADFDNQAKQLRARAQQEFNFRKDGAANTLYNEAGAWEQVRDFVLTNPDKLMARGNVERAGQYEGPSVTYHLASRLTVPSRNDEQVIEMARLDMQPEYYYKAVPVLTRHVYRLANLTNRSKYVLLPGEATMYAGTDFVGRMDLPLVAIGEQFTVGLGVEPQLQVQKQMVDKSRAMQGGNQVLKYEYRIRVNSFKAEKVRLQIWDRLPHAENETVAVGLVKASPELAKDPTYLREERPNNLLRWDVDVEPGSNGEKALTVNYEFKLELDRQMTLGAFTTK
jgi:hypothetical protein